MQTLNLNRELKDARCTMARESFEDLVVRAYREQFDHLPDEQMVRDPRRAHAFCNNVRAEAASPKLSDEVILGAVQNLRKAGRLILSRKKRAEAAGAEPEAAPAGPARRGRSGRTRRSDALTAPAFATA